MSKRIVQNDNTGIKNTGKSTICCNVIFLSDLFLKDFEIHIVGTFVFFDTKSVAKLCLL